MNSGIAAHNYIKTHEKIVCFRDRVQWGKLFHQSKINLPFCLNKSLTHTCLAPNQCETPVINVLKTLLSETINWCHLSWKNYRRFCIPLWFSLYVLPWCAVWHGFIAAFNWWDVHGTHLSQKQIRPDNADAASMQGITKVQSATNVKEF